METDTIRAENVDKFMQWIKFTMITKKWNKTIDVRYCAHFNSEEQYGTIYMNRNKRNKNNQDNLTN